MTFNLEDTPEWIAEFLAPLIEFEQPRFGTPQQVAEELGGRCRAQSIDIPYDCRDGFIQAFWQRPEALLDAEVRNSQSVWTLLEPGAERCIVDQLEGVLRSGEWDARFGHLRSQEAFEGGLRLIVSE